jgi:hypothetical protein
MKIAAFSPLVVPEHAHVHVNVAAEAEPLELPEVPGGRLLILNVELELQAGEIGLRQVLQPQVVEVIVGVVEAEDGEIFGGLADAGDRQAGFGRVMDGGRRGTAGETLHVHAPARVENVKRFRRQNVAAVG